MSDAREAAGLRPAGNLHIRRVGGGSTFQVNALGENGDK